MIPKRLCLYCCSYLEDINRVVRLSESISKYNADEIPFFISVPDDEVTIFTKEVKHILKRPIVIPETKIISLIPNVTADQIYSIRGGLRQQIIKSNFWKLGYSLNYLCLDSDCVFLRNFYISDFIFSEDIPYSVMHEGKSILQPTLFLSKRKHREYFNADRKPIQSAIGRPGITYDFGYAPFLWSSKVWMSLETEYLIPNKKSFLDIIVENGSEFTWYGEALLKYRAIPIYPREELFKHYHYFDQYILEKINGVNDISIKKDFLGKVMQSSWEKQLTHKSAKKPLVSMFILFIKHRFKKAYLKFKIFKNLLIK